MPEQDRNSFLSHMSLGGPGLVRQSHVTAIGDSGFPHSIALSASVCAVLVSWLWGRGVAWHIALPDS